MTHSQILKRAWDVTWRYKVLWLFGFLFGGGYSIQTSERFSNAETIRVDAVLKTAWDRVPVLVIAGGAVIVLLVIVLIIVAIAAEGGLVYLADEADSERSVNALPGFRVGLKRFWRVWGLAWIAVLAGLVALVVAVVPGLVAPPVFCVTVPLFGIALLAAAIVGVPVWALALRSIVLEGAGVTEAITRGWQTVRRRGNRPIVFGLLLLLIQVAGGVAFGAVALPIAFVADLLLNEGTWWAAYGVLSFVSLLLLLPAVLLATFNSVAWTVYFRRGDLPPTDMGWIPAPLTPSEYAGNPQ